MAGPAVLMTIRLERRSAYRPPPKWQASHTA